MKNNRFKAVFIPSILLLILVFFMLPNILCSEPEKPDRSDQQLLEKAARESLQHLKTTFKRDGFYSGRVSLTIWKMNAIAAGTFDPVQYDAFKKQLYLKSISDNLRWFEGFIEQADKIDAKTCLEVWKLHSQELGVFDPEKYQEMKDILKTVKIKKK